jgi:hypothetical protein
MLFNKLALTLLSIVAVAAALPTPSHVALDTDVVKRGSNGLVDVVTEPDTVVDTSDPKPRGCNYQSE